MRSGFGFRVSGLGIGREWFSGTGRAVASSENVAENREIGQAMGEHLDTIVGSPRSRVGAFSSDPLCG